MGVEITCPISQIPPHSVIKDDCANTSAVGDQFEEIGYDTFCFAGCEVFEEFRADNINAGELVGALITGVQFVADVSDEVARGIEGDVPRRAAGAQGERHEIVLARVRLDQRCHRQVGEDVAVIDDEGSVVHKVRDVGDAACGFQQHRFVAEGEGSFVVAGIWKSFRILPGEVVGVDDEFAQAGLEQVVERECDERSMEDRDERLGETVRQRPEPCAKARAQNKCLVHAGELRSDVAARKRN